MFADIEIKAGIRILADDPLFCIADTTIDDGIGGRISVSFEQLHLEQQQEFEKLHRPDHPTWTSLVSRYSANAFEMEPGTEVEPASSGIFLKASSINHSCRPNAFFAWNENLRQMTVHAMVDIPGGEEITVSYNYPFTSLESRQKTLRELYGFECDCSACRLDPMDRLWDDMHRDRMEEIFKTLEAYVEYRSKSEEEVKMLLDMILEFIKLAHEEGMDGHFLSYMYRYASISYADKGDKEMALRYAEMELERDKKLLGEDNPLSIESAKIFLNLKSEVTMQQNMGEESVRK